MKNIIRKIVVIAMYIGVVAAFGFAAYCLVALLDCEYAHICKYVCHILDEVNDLAQAVIPFAGIIVPVMLIGNKIKKVAKKYRQKWHIFEEEA